MFVNFRKVISWSVAVSWLAGVSLRSAGGPGVVGIIVRSAQASLGEVAIPDEGDTITVGGVLRTEKGGYALVRLSRNAEVSLLEGAAVRFGGARGQPVVQISSGTVVAERAGTERLVVETAGYRVEPAEQGKVICVVAMANEKDGATITARYGKLLVTEMRSGNAYLLQEGQSAATQEQPKDEQAKQESEPAPSKRAGQASGKATEEQTATTGKEESAETKKPAQKPAAPNQSHTGLILLGVGAAAAAGAAAALGGGGGGATVSSSTP